MGKKLVNTHEEETEILRAAGASRDMLMKAHDYVGSLPQIELEMNHFFAAGVYCRQMVIPAGVMVVGKIHKHETINIVSKGKIEVATEFGFEVITAPCTFVSQPGVKRAVRALEETIWHNCHGTNSTDLVEIEKQFIAQSYEEYDQFITEQKLLESTQQIEIEFNQADNMETQICLGEQ